MNKKKIDMIDEIEINKRKRLINHYERVREIKENLLKIKTQKSEDSSNGIIRIYPDEQSLQLELFYIEQLLNNHENKT